MTTFSPDRDSTRVGRLADGHGIYLHKSGKYFSQWFDALGTEVYPVLNNGKLVGIHHDELGSKYEEVLPDEPGKKDPRDPRAWVEDPKSKTDVEPPTTKTLPGFNRFDVTRIGKLKNGAEVFRRGDDKYFTKEHINAPEQPVDPVYAGGPETFYVAYVHLRNNPSFGMHSVILDEQPIGTFGVDIKQTPDGLLEVPWPGVYGSSTVSAPGQLRREILTQLKVLVGHPIGPDNADVCARMSTLVSMYNGLKE